MVDLGESAVFNERGTPVHQPVLVSVASSVHSAIFEILGIPRTASVSASSEQTRQVLQYYPSTTQGGILGIRDPIPSLVSGRHYGRDLHHIEKAIL